MALPSSSDPWVADVAPSLESLEPRLMLTTLVGGDVFEYVDASDQYIRVALDGDIIVEFILGYVDDTNSLLLGDVPGVITESTTGRENTAILGGLGGADGVELIRPTPITDTLFSYGSVLYDADGVDEITLQALASMDDLGNGASYAFNVFDADIDGVTRTLIQLVNVNNTSGEATVESMLQQASLNEDVAATLSDVIADPVTAFAVDPLTGLAYAAAADTLYVINRYTGATVPVGVIGGAVTGVQAMAFDSTGSLWAIGTSALGDATLVEVDTATANSLGTQTLSDGSANLTDLFLGMAFDPTDQLYGSASDLAGAFSNLYAIDTATGLSVLQGAIEVDSAETLVEGLAFAVDSDGNDILVGIDHSQIDNDTGGILPRLVYINYSPGLTLARPLCEPGAVSLVYGLSSYTEAGQTRPLLFATDGTDLIRGSAVSLDVDDAGATAIADIQGADFRPRSGVSEDNLLYFVARDGDDVDWLYTVDVELPSRSAIQNSVTRIGIIGSNSDLTVTSIAWLNGTTLYGFRENNTDDTGNIITIDQDTGSVTSSFNVVLVIEGEEPENVTDISAIEFVGGDVDNVYAIRNGTAEIIRIALGSGHDVFVLGSTSDSPDDDEESPIRGEDLQGIAWNPVLVNPFTGEMGALIGVDATSDELVYIDYRWRPAGADVFAIYVSQSSMDASISMAVVPDPEQTPRNMQPFAGTAGSFRVTNAQTGELVVIGAPGGTGGVLIGAKTRDIDPDDDEEDLRPILSGLLDSVIGVRPQGADDLPGDSDDVSAGMWVAESLLKFVSGQTDLANRLLGQNLDDISEMAVSRDGDIVVIDSDNIDSSGIVVSGDQIAYVDGWTGLASTPVDVTAGGTGVALGGIQGLDYGDIDMDGVEELYAILNVANNVPSASVGGDFGSDLFVNPQALTVTLGGAMYAIDQNPGGTFDLYRVNRLVSGALNPADPYDFLGEIYDVVNSNPVDQVYALDANPYTGVLTIIGADLGGEQTLYLVDTISQQLDLDVGLEVLATGIVKLNGGGETDPIEALAYRDTATGAELYVVQDIAGIHTLFTVDTTTGTMTEAGGAGNGAIEVSGTPAQVTEMDFDPSGNLVAIDASGGAGSIRLIGIDLNDPDQSAELSSPGSVDDDLVGLASDVLGSFYSINQMGVGTDDQIWGSPGMLPTLGQLDPVTGTFTQIAAVGGGSIGGVSAMAFSLGEGSVAGQQGLYIQDTGGVFYEIDPTDGSLLSGGDVVRMGEIDPATGSTVAVIDPDTGLFVDVTLESMDFDQSGDFFGHDPTYGRLVDIDISTLGSGVVYVGAYTTTTVGSVRPTVGAMAYDYSQDRFLVADNVTGGESLGDPDDEGDSIESSVLMELVGTDSDSAVGQDVDNILIGGTITGKVYSAGSFELFYAGWVNTGYANGLPETPTSSGNFMPGNFTVDGDLRNLVSRASIGTNEGTDDEDAKDDPDYLTGFDLRVGGKLGQLLTLDTFIGGVYVENSADVDGLNILDAYQQEVEARENTSITDPEGVMFQKWGLFETGGDFFNDTFETPQYIGTIRDNVLGDPDVVHVSGTLISANNYDDYCDFYALGLMAGQTVSVQFTQAAGWLRLGVFDPDGRLIASNWSDIDPVFMLDEPFAFTADRPGAYRFVVTFDLNPEFVPDPDDRTLGESSYEIMVSGVGDVGIGGVVAAGRDIFNPSWDPGIHLLRGDVGAIYAEQNYLTYTFNDVRVELGDLRAVVAGELGVATDGDLAIDYWPVLNVVDGNIGLIESLVDALGVQATVGGDIQVISAELLLWAANLSIDGGLGVMRADSMNSSAASIITVDADGSGFDGIIDLIDVVGNFGRIGPGGPQITIGGPGGNVRYIRVGGNSFQDSRYGGGSTADNFVTLAPGQSRTFVDDSGGIIRVSPTAGTIDLLTGAPTYLSELSYRTHGIYGSGGSVLMDVVSTGSIAISADSGGIGSPVEVTRIELQPPTDTVGRNVLIQPDGTMELEPDLGTNLNVMVNGPTPIDVFDVVGPNFTNINNYTGGEIVNATADSIGLLFSAGTIGLAKNHTGAAVNPVTVLDPVNVFPFDQQRIGIVVNGSILTVRSRQGVGNLIVDGSIDVVVANAEGTVDHTDGVFEGIAAPIYATGDINTVHIGEGIAPSGSGLLSHAGIYAEGNIGAVVGTGVGADIRGNIVAGGFTSANAVFVPDRFVGIRVVKLTGGSIVNANIMSTLDPVSGTGGLQGSREMPYTLEDATTVTPGSIGSIQVTGPGGIIGMYFLGSSANGNITVAGGFGILNSGIYYSVGDSAILGDTVADGFGIRGVTFMGGASQGDIIATGRGELISTLDYSPTVRYSELYGYDPVTDTGGYDPLFGQWINRLTDIHSYLGTAAWMPLDVAGVIDNVRGMASRDLGLIKAYEITDSTFDYANSIEGLTTLGDLNTVEITTGKIGAFRPAGDVSGLSLNIAGRIDRIIINGSLLGGSVITANGPNGDIRYLRVDGDMDGDIIAKGIIRTVIIGGDLTGNIVADNTNADKLVLQSLRLGGSLTNGSLDLNGDVGTIDAAGSFGIAGDALHITGDLRTLKVGTSSIIDGSALGLDIDVVGNLNILDVTGMITGNVFVGGSMNRVTVKADALTTGTNIVTGNVTALGQVKSVFVSAGNLAADLTAGQDLGAVRITNGNLAAGATVASSFGDIKSVAISGGDLLGDVRAENGTIKSISVTGSDIGSESAISAQSVGSLRVDGSILGGASIAVDDELARLQVGVDVEALASIVAGSTGRADIGRDLAGSASLGYYDRGTMLTVGRDLSGAVTVDGDSRLTVGRNLSGAAWIGGDMTSMSVVGEVSGQAIIEGAVATVKAGSLAAGVLTSGYDIRSMTVSGAMANSLIQVGVSAGSDGLFGTADPDETGRMGSLGTLSIAGAMTNSVIAAGGDIGRATMTGGMTNSSVSSGLNVGGSAIDALLKDNTPLAAIGEVQAALSGADRQLFHGDFGSAVVAGAGMAASHLTAGIDAGTDGDFANAATNTIASSLTGGQSTFKSVSAVTDVNSTVLADSGIVGNNAIGLGTVNGNVSYSVATDLAAANPLETAIGTAISGTPLTYTTNGGHVVTITLTGNGQVVAYDEAGADSDDVIDTLVISAADSRTQVTIVTSTPGAVGIGRILTSDDVSLGLVAFDGDLVGDGTDDADLWIDGPVGTLSFRDLADDWDGQIGGDVSSLTIETQGSGKLYVGGSIRLLTITNSGSDPLVNALAAVPSSDIAAMAVDSADDDLVWVFDSVTGNLSQVNVNTGVVVSGPVSVTDSATGGSLILSGMDFLTGAPDVLYGIASLYNQSPTVQVGSLSSSAISLNTMAVNDSGEVFAIRTVGGEDVLVKIDPTGGGVELVGTLADVFTNTYNNDVLAMAFDDMGTLVALVSDRDGTGGAYGSVDGVAIVEIETTDSNGDGLVRVSSPTSQAMPGVLIDGGGMTNSFRAIAVELGVISLPFSEVYAVRRNLLDTQDELTTIEPDGTVTVIGVIQVAGADTNIIGMGFDESGNLIAYNNDGATAGLIMVDTTDPTGSSVAITADGALSTDIDAFAVGRIGSNFATYGYDTDGVVGGMFYTNPGTISTLGIVDTATGEMVQLRSLSQDDTGTPLSSSPVGLAIDNLGLGNNLHVVTADGRLLVYEEAEGAFLKDYGAISDIQTGELLNISALEFNDVTGELIGIDAMFNRLVTIEHTYSALDAIGDLGGDYNIQALTVTADDTMYAVDNDGGTFRLYRVSRNESGQVTDFTLVGDIDDGTNAVTAISGMEIDTNGTIYVVGTRLAVNPGGDQELMTIDPVTGVATVVAALTDPAAVTDSIDAIAFDASDGLYAVRDVAGVQTLYTVNAATGFMTEVVGAALATGEIRVDSDGDGVPDDTTSIVSMVFDANGDLLAIDTGAGAGTGRPIEINLADPGLSVALEAANAIAAGVTGFAVDSAGAFYTVGGASTPDEVLRSFPGAATGRMERGAVDGSNLTVLAYDYDAGDPANSPFYSVDDLADQFVQFGGTSQSDLGGITANSIDRLNIGGAGYGGRIVATGNTIGMVTVVGDFTGSITTGSDLKRFTQTDGDFGGLLTVGKSAGMVSTTGDFLTGGTIVVGEQLTNLKVAGSLAGLVSAYSAKTISVGVAGESTSQLAISGEARTVTFGGSFAGSAVLGSAVRLSTGGSLADGGYVYVGGDVTSLIFSGGTAPVGYAAVYGSVGSLSVGGVHEGTIAVRKGMKSGRMGELSEAILVVGEDTGTLRVSGDSTDSLVSFGTWIGDDEVYNTADDIITGGSVKSVMFMGDFRDSGVVAGVLPHLDYGPGIPLDMRAYTGNEVAGNIEDIDSAEAGGILVSTISSLTIRGSIINTVSSFGWCSVAAAADGIDRINAAGGGQLLLRRSYDDPFGAPVIERVEFVNESEGRIYFSEELNTASFILSQDLDEDGTVTGPADILGTVLAVSETGEVLDDVELDYTTNTLDTGEVQGVLIVRRTGGFDVSLVTISVSGSLVDPSAYDRSGLRSSLRDMDQDGVAEVGEDQAGTILDGNTSGSEGGAGLAALPFVDMPDSFDDSVESAEFELVLGAGTTITGDEFDSSSDVDVWRFDAGAYDFLSVHYVGSAPAQMGLFHQDTQGTWWDTSDDFFELVARHESMAESTDDLFMAFELPASGEYFLAITPTPATYDPEGNNVYGMEFVLASTDVALLADIGGLPTDEEIAYVSNSIAEHNNLLGANAPAQLVYLNFDGGTATRFEVDSSIDVEAFDLAEIDPILDGYENEIINGSIDVTGIVENVIAIYSNTPVSHPSGDLNIQQITTLAEWAAATEGIYFTTVDPALWGLDADVDFTTIFIGKEDEIIGVNAGLLGQASNTDLASQEASDNGIVFTQNFSGASSAVSVELRLNEYSRLLANTIAHELGHTLGLNHQPTLSLSTDLLSDDPDNNIWTPNDSNTGPGLMAYPTTAEELAGLDELGTARLSTEEFPIGHIDTAELLLLWLS